MEAELVEWFPAKFSGTKHQSERHGYAIWTPLLLHELTWRLCPLQKWASTSDINRGPHIPFWLTTVTYKTPHHILYKPAALIKCLIFIHHSASILPPKHFWQGGTSPAALHYVHLLCHADAAHNLIIHPQSIR